MTVDVASRVQDKVLDTKQQVYGGAEALQAKVPSPVAARIGPLMASAMQRPLPTAAVMVVMLMVLRLVVRRLWRGNS